MARVGRWALLLVVLGGAPCAAARPAPAPGPTLFRGVDHALLFDNCQLERNVVHVLRGQPSPGIVHLASDGHDYGLLGVYRSVAVAQEVLAAFAVACVGQARPVAWHGRRAPDAALWWAGAPGDEHRLALRYRNLVWIVESAESLPALERRAEQFRARLDADGVAERGDQVPVPPVSVHDGAYRGVLAGDGPAPLHYSSDNGHTALLTPAGALYLPVATTAVDVFDGSARASVGGEFHTVTVAEPGLGRADCWFATERNVVFRVQGEFTVRPADGSNRWLREWRTTKLRLHDLDSPADAPLSTGELALNFAEHRFTRPWRAARRAVRRDRARLARFVQSEWLPPHDLTQVGDLEQRGDTRQRAVCWYRGGTVRLAWVTDGQGRQYVYAEQDLADGAESPNLPAWFLFSLRHGSYLSSETYDRSLDVGVQTQRVHVDMLMVEPRPWPWHWLVLGLAVHQLRRSRRRPRARQRF